MRTCDVCGAVTNRLKTIIADFPERSTGYVDRIDICEECDMKRNETRSRPR